MAGPPGIAPSHTILETAYALSISGPKMVVKKRFALLQNAYQAFMLRVTLHDQSGGCSRTRTYVARRHDVYSVVELLLSDTTESGAVRRVCSGLIRIGSATNSYYPSTAKLVDRAGVAPAAFSVQGRCIANNAFGPKWTRKWDLHPRLPALQAVPLATWVFRDGGSVGYLSLFVSLKGCCSYSKASDPKVVR